MKVRSISWRVAVASLLTGISSALVVVLLTAAVGVGGFSPEIVVLLWLIGSVAATVAALILGIVIELPKAYWLSRRPSGGKILHVFVSVAGALAILAVWILVPQMTTQGHIRSDPDFLFPAFAFAVGGLCSALFWWGLVVLPWRTARS